MATGILGGILGNALNIAMGAVQDYTAPRTDIKYPDATGWQSNVTSWLNQNPNATPDQISQAATANGGSYDSTTGNFSLNGQTYNPNQAKAAVTELYGNYLGRAADQGGLDYWSQKFGNTVETPELQEFLKAAAVNRENVFKTPEGVQGVQTRYNDQLINDYLTKLNQNQQSYNQQAQGQYQAQLDQYNRDLQEYSQATGVNGQYADRNGYWIDSRGNERQGAPTAPVSPVKQMPTTAAEFWSTYGSPQADGFTPIGKQGFLEQAANQGNGLTSWMGTNFSANRYDPTKANTDLLPHFSLYGTGSKEDIQKGFNVLQNMAPQDLRWIFPQLSPDVQKGILQHPDVALQQMAAYANPANKSWLSIGAEGGFSDPSAFGWDPQKGLTVDRSKYLQIHDGDSWSKPLGALATLASFVPGLQPLGMATNAFLAARADNPMGVVASVLPATGLGGALTNGIQGMTGLGNVASGALASGLTGAGMGLLSGQDFGTALKGGALGAAGSYLGSLTNSYVDSAAKNAGLSPTQASAAKNAVKGVLNTALKGGSLQEMLTSGALSAGGGLLSGQIASTLGEQTGMNDRQAQGMASYIVNQLYRQYVQSQQGGNPGALTQVAQTSGAAQNNTNPLQQLVSTTPTTGGAGYKSSTLGGLGSSTPSTQASFSQTPSRVSPGSGSAKNTGSNMLDRSGLGNFSLDNSGYNLIQARGTANPISWG